MLNTLEGIVHKGKIELLETAVLSEGAHVLVTVLQNEETQFWAEVSQNSLEKIWNNPEDDIYAELLQK
ncbi:hypothetical protein WDW89_15710 [Deltaproteobacteria bacterium TL4]